MTARHSRAWPLIVAIAFAPALAFAQAKSKPAPEPKPEPAGDEVEMTDDTDEAAAGDDDGSPIAAFDDDGSLAGTSENPNAPKDIVGGKDDDPSKSNVTNTGYPMELAQRPITLAGRMSEVFIDYPVNFDPFFAGGVLRASYGITRQVEAGLRYGLGSVNEDGFSAGKAIAIDAVYLIKDFVGVQLSVPILLDPFAMGVTLGVPLKFQFGDRFALFGGRDLVSFKIAKFVPDVNNALANQGLIALHESNTTLPKGDIRVIGGFIYQLKPKMALSGEIGIIATDFGTTDAPVVLRGTLTYSMSNKIDVGARAGFGDLGEATHSAGIALFAALRI